MTMIECPIMIPPIMVDDYEEFKKLARNASLITYDLDYLQNPFLDETPRARRVTFWALGIPINGLPITVKFSMDYTEVMDKSRNWLDQADEIEKALLKLVNEIEDNVPMIKGRIELDAPDFSSLVIRP